MENNPLVTVNILSYNRKEDLRNTLEKVYEQDYKNIEVIVVDNASNDGSSEMVKENFPSVRLIKMEKNTGVSGWNNGIQIANGKYLLLLDDDAYPEYNSITKAVVKFEEMHEVGCIAFNIIDLNKKNTIRTKWLPEIHVQSCEWPTFVGCAAIFRSSLNLIIPDDYFLYQHELPVAAQLVNAGFKILYYKEILAYHYFKNEKAYNKNQDKFNLANNMKFIRNYMRLTDQIRLIFPMLVFYFFKSLYRKWFKEFITIVVNRRNYTCSIKQYVNTEYVSELKKIKIINSYFTSSILARIKN